MTFGIMTVSRKTFGKMTVSRMTFGIMTVITLMTMANSTMPVISFGQTVV
jgi:hypothetical protein